MIETIFADHCSGCNECVVACPDHVFDYGPQGQAPLIARPEQCQTCFLCEVYCPQDAIYVGVTGESNSNAQTLASAQQGRIRHDYGWDGSQPDPLRNFWQLGPLLRQGVEISAARYARYEEAHAQLTVPKDKKEL